MKSLLNLHLLSQQLFHVMRNVNVIPHKNGYFAFFFISFFSFFCYSHLRYSMSGTPVLVGFEFFFSIFYSLSRCFFLLNKFHLNKEFQNLIGKSASYVYTLYNYNFTEVPSTIYGTLICEAFEIVSNEILYTHAHNKML